MSTNSRNNPSSERTATEASGLPVKEFKQFQDLNSLLGVIKGEKMKNLSALDKCLWDPLIHLFDRPWFRRIWVIQEWPNRRRPKSCMDLRLSIGFIYD